MRVRMCELLWDMERADQVQAVIESASGAPCPCMRGMHCPLVPVGKEIVLPKPTPALSLDLVVERPERQRAEHELGGVRSCALDVG